MSSISNAGLEVQEDRSSFNPLSFQAVRNISEAETRYNEGGRYFPAIDIEQFGTFLRSRMATRDNQKIAALILMTVMIKNIYFLFSLVLFYIIWLKIAH
jgi:hypothetical protein